MLLNNLANHSRYVSVHEEFLMNGPVGNAISYEGASPIGEGDN